MYELRALVVTDYHFCILRFAIVLPSYSSR